MGDTEELRIVLLGKTGVGKSSVGNRILGENKFTAECSPESRTKICERAEKESNGRSIVVIDTPGIFDTNRSEEDLKYEIISCLVECAPGPHVFILVLQVERHTEGNQKALEKLLEYFTGDAVPHMVLLFTRGDDLKENMTIDDFIKKSDVEGKESGKQSLKDLAERCGKRVHVIDNKHWDEKRNVSSILASLQGLNLSEQALREIAEKMPQTPDEQTPWFKVLSDNGGNAEAGGNEEQRQYRNNRYQLTQLMKSVKDILTRSNSGHYSNEALEETGKAINEEVKNILKEMGVERKAADMEDIRRRAIEKVRRESQRDVETSDAVDMVEVRRTARERVIKKLQRILYDVPAIILLQAFLGIKNGLASVAGFFRNVWRRLTRQNPPTGDGSERQELLKKEN